MSKQIAIIGSGISGLVSAFLLGKRYQVTLFEANDYLGGHTATTEITLDGKKHQVDTGFLVFNKENYPNFTKLLAEHNISIQKSEMSFSYRSNQSPFEYNGHNLNTLFADRKYLFKPSFYKFIFEILRFNYLAKEFVKTANFDISIEEFIKTGNFSSLFKQAYLIPIIASIWSSKIDNVMACSATFILTFFYNQGLLNINKRPQWYGIMGGSRNYIPSLLKSLNNSNIYLNSKIEKIERYSNKVVLKTSDNQFDFDMVVIATHSDQALDMLVDPTVAEKTVLSALKYTKSQVILHTDSRLLPKNELAWASWNYYDIGSLKPTLTYYLNRLQNINAEKTILLSMNLEDKIDPDKILNKFSYAHPCYTIETLKMQKDLPSINGKNNTYYCGAYWGYGFHEDGVNSALEVCRLLGVAG